MTPEERKSLEAVMHYAIESSSEAENLIGVDDWKLAKDIVRTLLTGGVRKTTSIPEGFSLQIEVVHE